MHAACRSAGPKTARPKAPRAAAGGYVPAVLGAIIVRMSPKKLKAAKIKEPSAEELEEFEEGLNEIALRDWLRRGDPKVAQKKHDEKLLECRDDLRAVLTLFLSAIKWEYQEDQHWIDGRVLFEQSVAEHRFFRALSDALESLTLALRGLEDSSREQYPGLPHPPPGLTEHALDVVKVLRICHLPEEDK